MVKFAGRYLVALLGGAFLALTVPVITALTAAAPGLAGLLRLIKAAGVPGPAVYFALTNFLPALLLSNLVGLFMFRVLGGKTGDLLAVAAIPWVMNAMYFYAELCVGNTASCTGMFELVGLAVVPLGLLIAALLSKPRTCK